MYRTAVTFRPGHAARVALGTNDRIAKQRPSLDEHSQTPQSTNKVLRKGASILTLCKDGCIIALPSKISLDRSCLFPSGTDSQVKAFACSSFPPIQSLAKPTTRIPRRHKYREESSVKPGQVAPAPNSAMRTGDESMPAIRQFPS